MSSEFLDLTPFAWKVQAWDADTLRIMVWCAEGFSKQLQRCMEGLEIQGRVKSRCSVEIAKQQSVARFIAWADIPRSWRNSWDDYFCIVDKCHKGVKLSSVQIEERRRAVRAVLAGAPKLDEEDMNNG